MSTTTPLNVPIHPLATYHPSQMEVSNARWSKVWALAAIVSAVAFIAIASIGFAYTTLYLESQLPLVAILIFAVGLPSSFRAFSYMWNKSSDYAEEALIDKKMISYMSHLDVSKELGKLGVAPVNSALNLESLIARYTYCQKRKDELLANADGMTKGPIELSIQDRVHKINPEDYTVEKIDFTSSTEKAIFEDLQTTRAAKEYLIHRAALLHLRSAYYLIVMQNPYAVNPEGAFVQVPNISLPHRMIAAKYGDLSSNVVVKTATKSYTAKELLSRSTYNLAKEIFGLPNYHFIY